MKDPHAWHKNENIENENKPICAYQNVSVNGNCQVQTIINNGIVLTEINNDIVKTTIVYNNNTTFISEFNTVKETINTKAYNGTTLRYETEMKALEDFNIYFQQIDRTVSPPITKNIDTSKYYDTIEMNKTFVDNNELMAPIGAVAGITTFVALMVLFATIKYADKFALNFSPPIWRIYADMNNRINTSFNGTIESTATYYGNDTPRPIQSVKINIKVPRPEYGANGKIKKV